MTLEWGAHAARGRFSAARQKPRSAAFRAPFDEEQESKTKEQRALTRFNIHLQGHIEAA
jgi:hypothetical protein